MKIVQRKKKQQLVLTGIDPVWSCFDGRRLDRSRLYRDFDSATHIMSVWVLYKFVYYCYHRSSMHTLRMLKMWNMREN